MHLDIYLIKSTFRNGFVVWQEVNNYLMSINLEG